MEYSSFLLDGTWEMCYKEDKYTKTENPWKSEELNLKAHSGDVESAVPGYWEDMTDSFLKTPFFCFLRINPEYGIQQYPISGVAPDMALPNVVGTFFYQRTFVCKKIDKPAVVHFDGVQNYASVWVNDTYIGTHEGYSTSFDMEIPHGIITEGENTIALSVSNHRLEGYDGYPVSGLTSRAANECTGGVTGSIELRVYHCPLRDVVIKVSNDVKSVNATVISNGPVKCQWQVLDGDKVIKSGDTCGEITFDTRGMELWCPENPKLYTLNIICEDSSLTRSFGVRRLLPNGTHFTLNGKPYFLRGICEHCYFPETIHPAHDLTYYRSIVREIKKLGFNFIRFHTYIPEEEYMQAADELGVLLHVESPNNTSLSEWKEIVEFCRRHTSVVIYCCGNELQMDDAFIEHIKKCSDAVHQNTDSLFSPMSAMRGLEYCHIEADRQGEILTTPFEHHPRRLKTVSEFSDMFSSYARGVHSYTSLDCDPVEFDSRSVLYHHKPRVSHEICIDGTYTDLSLKGRYKGTRVGKTDMFDSIERHLEAKGMLKKAPLYFKNSSEWQRRVRKYCFEAVRRSENVAGYDFLGPIDTHWHTFGYDVGMMNEFYELKPGETVRNVLMYNSETVLLNDLMRKTNFASGDTLSCGIYTSCYHKKPLENAQLSVKLYIDGKVFERKSITIDNVKNDGVSKLHNLSITLPTVCKPASMKLCVTLDCGELYAENEWELYLFPVSERALAKDLVVSKGMSADLLKENLENGKTVVLLGAEPFNTLPTSFRIALSGRTSGNLATVIADHPAMADMPNEGFCGWQFGNMLEKANAVCFECENVPFNPIIEVVSTHKFAIRQAALFEFNALGGKLLVCSLNLDGNDPGAKWFEQSLISYAGGDSFNPADTIDSTQLDALINSKVITVASNNNMAFNPNDKTSTRRKKN